MLDEPQREEVKTFLVPSVTHGSLDLEEDTKPIEIKLDHDFEVMDICNSEGALEPRDYQEIEVIEIDTEEDRGRQSDIFGGKAARIARSPQPKGYQQEGNNGKENLGSDAQGSNSDLKNQYNKSTKFRKMQMQRNRQKQISSKVSIGKGSNDGGTTPQHAPLFGFLSTPLFQDGMNSPVRRNLANEFASSEAKRGDMLALDKE